VLPAAAQPQVTPVHQEIDPVLFGRDGIRIGFRDPLHHFGARDIQLITAVRPLLGANPAGNDDGRFLRQIFEVSKSSSGTSAFTATH
jgi:hypothetical protein